MRGFSLVEILVAMGVLAMMSLLTVSLITSAQGVSQRTTSRVEQFREARRAFDRINQRLSQATLNTYWDYVNAAGQPRTSANVTTFIPGKYAKISELRYLQTGANALSAPREGSMVGQAVFFQAPLGSATTSTLSRMNSLLNTVGYFIEEGSDITLRPPTISGPAKIRRRLFELTEPTENLTVYKLTSGAPFYIGDDWFTTPLANTAYSQRLADNIVALLFQAEYKNANGDIVNSYSYSSEPRGSASQPIEENNLPPVVHVTLIAVDEVSGRRMQDRNIALPDAQDETGLATLEAVLRANRLNYRKFESTLSIGPAKWSAK